MFGIEQDAYFFNMIWASYNLLFMVGALLVAWERPQRRADERVRCEVPVRIVNGSVDPRDDAGREPVGLLAGPRKWPDRPALHLRPRAGPERRRRTPARGARVSRARGAARSRRRALHRPVGEGARGDPARRVRAQRDVGSGSARTSGAAGFGLAAAFLSGFVRYFRPSRHVSRRYPTRQVLRVPRRLGRNQQEERLAARRLARRRRTPVHGPPTAHRRAVADLRAAVGARRARAAALPVLLARRNRGDRGAVRVRDAGLGTAPPDLQGSAGNCLAW